MKDCVVALTVALYVSFAASVVEGQITTGTITVELEEVADVSGSGAPNYLTHAGDHTDRQFVVTQGGRVRLIKEGSLEGTSFLDIPSAGIALSTSGERGLLGLAFHPDFAASAGTPGAGKVYTYTSEPGTGTVPDFNHPELGNVAHHHSVIREWTVDPANPDVVDTSVASRVVMRINQPQGNHNGGLLDFGADKNLYIFLGDGGGSNDQQGGINNNSDGHTNGEVGNAQDTSNVYGSVLRINPADTIGATGNLSANGQYTVPTDNPFVDLPGVDEIWAYGLRNPWRGSFDRVTGDLYVGDVGQGQVEEVDLIVKEGNYGWVNFEGTRVNRAGGPDFADTVAPIAEYGHGDGISVIGGFVYRGHAFPQLSGKFVFGEFRGPENVGRLFYMDLPGGEIFEFQIDPLGAQIADDIHGFGEDGRGELYVLVSNGEVLKFLPEPASLVMLAVALFAVGGRRGLDGRGRVAVTRCGRLPRSSKS